MRTRQKACREGMLECDAQSHALEEATSLFADAVTHATAGHDVFSLPSSYLDDHVRESLKRKGVLGDPGENASAVPVTQHTNNARVGDEENAGFKDRGVAWILARQDSRKRSYSQPACSLDFSSFEVELLSSNDIQNFLVEGAQLCAFGQAEQSTPRKNVEAGCPVEATPRDHPDGEMDPLTPEIVQNRGRSPSADNTSSPEPEQGVISSHGKETQHGELLQNVETCTNRLPNEQPTPTKETVQPQEQVSQEVQRNVKEKTQRKRKYMPKIRAEKSRAGRAKKPRTSGNARPPVVIPAETSSPSLLQMKKFARINQRPPKRRRRSKAAVNPPACAEREPPVVQDTAQSDDFARFLQEALFTDHPIKLCKTPSPRQKSPADRGSSSNGSLFTFLFNWVRLPESNQGSSCFGAEAHADGCSPCPSSPRTAAWSSAAPLVEEMNHSSSVEEHPHSTPRGPTVEFVSACRDFTLVTPSSPPSPRGAVISDAADLWDNFELESRVSIPSVRRALKFDAQLDEPVVPWLHKCHINQLNQVNVEMSQLAAQNVTGVESEKGEDISVQQQAAMDINPRESREKELQMVVYDDGSKKMVVYKKPPRIRRIRYKPKVNLDSSTVRMFKTLTIKGAGEDEAADEREKASWEQARHQWHHRAHHFISIMRQVQGSRAFSRWKGSVVDSVGGAFLTQNVSDFLSSNAFISLRARFPARKTDAKKGTETSTTPLEKEPAPVEDNSLPIQRPQRPIVVELKKQQVEDDQRQEEASARVAAMLNSNNVNEDTTCVEQSLTDIVEILKTGLNECHIEPKEGKRPATTLNHEETDPFTRSLVANFWKEGKQVVIRQRKESNGDVEVPKNITSEFNITETTEYTMTHVGAIEVKATVSLEQEHHDLVERIIPEHLTDVAPEELVLPKNHSGHDLSPKSVDVVEPECVQEPRVGETLHPVEPDGEEEELDPPPEATGSSLWKGKLASTVIQAKFASVLTESVSNLTVVGKEKVLAATLRLVLGKKQTTRELGLGKGNLKALRNPKLRPARAVLRSSTDNYRYRHNVSFRLLSGEARASWEAGFVMKCQKAKWEPLRAAILADENYCRDPLTGDCVDWAAVQKASVHEVADVIKNRGMNNALAGRMKAFLDRVHRDQNGSIDLEWIRMLPPEDAKAFLMSFRGVGLKSVECIRLLTLHHPSFPVDTNVGRILVRLGWVPLEPLPEETQLHLLELYPIQSQIQQYIWPRLCTLDQKTLYELHYQMITFGKVFCTKSKPNCNACPMRSECKHYASSYASAKLLLKWPEKQEKQSTILALQGSTDPSEQTESTQCSTLTKEPCIPIIEEPYIPIVEEPRSPEPNTDSIPDIEELPFNVDFNTRGGPVETNIGPSSRFSVIIGELSSILDENKTLLDLNCEPEPDTTFLLPPDDTEMMQPPQVLEMITNKVPTMGNAEVALEKTQVTVEEGVEEPASRGVIDEEFKHLPSQELILLPPQASLAPAPKLKNVQRLRTVHFVYELPDNHPLLFEMDKREADDPCFYLLAIWSPDEVPATMPKINDDDASNPFASCQDNDPEQTVRGTLLIPCKTAMRGWFPLNGTYFQVNEVFADHASSVQPIDVPRTLLWSLRRRFVYFSTAVSNLFKDMSQEEIQCCFQKGYVCLRAFDVATRQPKILAPRLHQSGAKIVKAPAPRKSRGRGRKSPTKDKPKTKTTKNPTSEAPLMETTEAPAMTHEGL